MKFKLHMRGKILILCLGSTLIALILQTILFQNTSSRIIYDQAKEESFTSLKNMQNDIYSFTKNIEHSLIKIYSEKDFVKDLRTLDDVEELNNRYYRFAHTFATENFNTSDAVVSFYIYTSENEIISTYRRAVTPKHNYAIDIYENEAEQNAGIVKAYVKSQDAAMLVSSYYNPYRETDIVRFVLKIYNNSNLNDSLGYLVCDIDSKVIRSIMQKYSSSQEVLMWIQPMGDRPIVSIGDVGEKDWNDYLEAAEKINNEVNEDRDLTSSNRVFFQVSQSKYNLDAYSLMPRSLLSQNQKTLTRNVIFIALIMIVAATTVTMVISKSMTRPLVKLTETMKRIRMGETELRASISNNDEIGELGSSFNRMLDEMEVLTQQKIEVGLLINKAEYKALQAQINPHFLYNTLDTMSSIATVQNCTRVSGLCQSLANIFRYSLDMKRPFSTISKEIIHLKNYIYVMNERMTEKIEYIFEIDNKVLQDTLPRITIQPLVENAINHGLKNKRGAKKIIICAQEVQDKLEISVADNGVGMSKERIEDVLNNKMENSDGSDSIGIHNIQSRILMLYGENAEFGFESEIGAGTKITIQTPRMKMEDMMTWGQ